MIEQTDVQARLKRFQYQITELEIAQDAFCKTLEETKFEDLWHDFSIHVYHARCALQKLQHAVDNSKDRSWFE